MRQGWGRRKCTKRPDRGAVFCVFPLLPNAPKCAIIQTENDHKDGIMTKETLTLAGIIKDLKIVADSQIGNAHEWRMTYIMPSLMLAAMFGILLRNLWIVSPLIAFAAYHAVRYAMEYKDSRAKRKQITAILERGDICISKEQFSHVAKETVYEPHTSRLTPTSGTHAHLSKTVTSYYFLAGGSWRLPDVETHYEWSREHYISSDGLQNISLVGDEFFRISLKGNPEISYRYPCKLFTLGDGLTVKE